jgi:hypothetical protein
MWLATRVRFFGARLPNVPRRRTAHPEATKAGPRRATLAIRHGGPHQRRRTRWQIEHDGSHGDAEYAAPQQARTDDYAASERREELQGRTLVYLARSLRFAGLMVSGVPQKAHARIEYFC